jgi:hypothetical protein
MLNFRDLAVLKVGIVFTEQSGNDIPQAENLKAPNQIENQPPAQDVALAAASFATEENKIMFCDRIENFTLSLSWVYQPFEAYPGRLA